MRTRDLKPGVVYSTCNGNRIELVEPVHARWALTEEGDFVELDEDALPGRVTDPWGKCHTTKAQIGIRARRWNKDDIDRNGDIREGAEPVEVVLKAEDIAGPWRDYLVLHGATVRQHAITKEGEWQEERYREAARARVAELFGYDPDRVNVSVRTWRREDPEWTFSIDMDPVEVATLVGDADLTVT